MPSQDLPGGVAETHVSYVFFTSELALKVKKPTRMAFVDYSTLDARRQASEREVVLNSRLAPHVYRGVATLTLDDGEVLDHVVVMRRLPPSRRLAALVEADDASITEELKRLARVVADFHGDADRSRAIDSQAGVDAVTKRWRDNSDELGELLREPSDRALLAGIEKGAADYIRGRTKLFEGRIAAGRAVDGHGDLLADDVFCLNEGPVVLDCLEFSDELRYGDALADVAFLAMDLERLGRDDLAQLFLASYAEAASDAWPTSLAHHYIAYRAQVRAKVAALRGDEQSARELLGMVVRRLRAGTVRLVLLGGGPATGKSTIAGAIAEHRSLALLRSDVVRKELSGVPVTESATAQLRRGIYSDDVTAQTYAELLRRARGLLERGESVVVDATWSSSDHRAVARQIAADTAADLVELRCDAPAYVATARAAQRALKERDASDADPSIALALAESADAWPEAVALDTSVSVDLAIRNTLRVIDDSWSRASAC